MGLLVIATTSLPITHSEIAVLEIIGCYNLKARSHRRDSTELIRSSVAATWTGLNRKFSCSRRTERRSESQLLRYVRTENQMC